MRVVVSGRVRSCGRDFVREGFDLFYSLISCCACTLASGSYIIMSRPEAIIALVARWYEENMRRPVETKGRPLVEKRLAKKWHALLKHKSRLPFPVLVEADALHEQIQSCGVNILATWMSKYKRCPKRGRGVAEDKFARQWKQLLIKANDLPPGLKCVVMSLRHRLSTDPAWIEAERTDNARVKAYTARKRSRGN